jgi:hypothetical protein
MALGDSFKVFRDTTAAILTKMISNSVVWVKGPVAWICNQVIEFLLNVLVRPFYEKAERAKETAPTNKEVDKKIEAVKKAQTEAEIDKAIDEMP